MNYFARKIINRDQPRKIRRYMYEWNVMNVQKTYIILKKSPIEYVWINKKNRSYKNNCKTISVKCIPICNNFNKLEVNLK